MSDRADSRRRLFVWELLAGLSLYGGIAAVGQAIRGNGSDELFFTSYAVVLIPVGLVLLWRSARRVDPNAVAMTASLATVFGADAGIASPWWIEWPLGLLVFVLASLLLAHREGVRG